MDYSQIRSWLGLPPGPWPPDHYTLLGLAPGRSDPAAVEPRVLERMDLLRRRQLLQPELVTEGMNRLAQALIVLTDPIGKAEYDAGLGLSGPPPPAQPTSALPAPPPKPKPTEEVADAVVVGETVFDDDLPLAGAADDGEGTQEIVSQVSGGPRKAGSTTPRASESAYSADSEIVTVEVLPPDTPTAPPRAVPVEEFVEGLPVGTGTATRPTEKRWVYIRLALLRKAIAAWARLGIVVGDPQDPVDRPGRVLLLLEGVWAVRPLLPSLQGVMGSVGQPGGVVGAVVRQPLVLDTFRRLLPSQRQTVAIDWRRGQMELQREYSRLRAIARAGREGRAGTRSGLAVWQALSQFPELALIALAGVALVLAGARAILGR